MRRTFTWKLEGKVSEHFGGNCNMKKLEKAPGSFVQPDPGQAGEQVCVGPKEESPQRPWQLFPVFHNPYFNENFMTLFQSFLFYF